MFAGVKFKYCTRACTNIYHLQLEERESPFEIPQLISFGSPADDGNAHIEYDSLTCSSSMASLSDFNKWDDYEIVETDDLECHHAHDHKFHRVILPFDDNVEKPICNSGRRRSIELEDDARSDKSSSRRGSGSSEAATVLLGLSSERSACLQIHPAHVRWFYKQEIDKKWTPFIGYDSLRLEIRFRLTKNEDVHPYLDGSLAGMSQHDRDVLFCMNAHLVVRGGLYEADVESRCCNSIFWNGERSIITRGTWFYDGTWQPLEDQFAEVVENEHMIKFSRRSVSELGQTNNYRRPVSEAIHDVSFTDFRVEWFSKSDVYLYSEAKSSKIMRSVSERFGFQKSGYKLERGYYVDATLDDRQPDITHLVFVVHGIGHKMDTEKIIRNCGALRKSSNWLKEKYFAHLNETNERSEFFPVEWRSSLKLDGDTVDSITPHRVRGLREFLNCSAMDVMYYTSPLYRKELIHALQTRMNDLYSQFCHRNPHFEQRKGRVSIVAHSLGTVISYDIITSWNPLDLYGIYADRNHHPAVVVEPNDNDAANKERGGPKAGEILRKLNETRKHIYDLELQLQREDALSALSTTPTTTTSPTQSKNGLLFAVENFFCLGSPLAVFLALRGVRPRGRGTRDDILPTRLVRRLFNIYHPTDPVAYRLEPLVLKNYSSISPLHIHYYASVDKDPYEQMKIEYLSALDLNSAMQQDKRPHSPPQGAVDLEGPDSAISSPNKSIAVAAAAVSAADSRWSFYWPSFMKRSAVGPASAATQMQSSTEFSKVPSFVQLKLLQDGDDAETIAVEEPPCAAVTTDGRNGSVSRVDDLAEVARSESPAPSVGEEAGYETPETTELEYRLDYVLREGNLESSYISAFTSHTAYWNSYDVAYFILNYLHPDGGDSRVDTDSPISPPSSHL